MYYFLKNLLYFQALIRQTKYIVMMTKEGSNKIETFMAPGAGVLALGRGHKSHIMKILYTYIILCFSMHKSNKLFYSYDGQGKDYQNRNFHDPRGGGPRARVWPLSYSEIALIFLKKNSLLTGIDQPNYVKRFDDQKGFSKIGHFMTP